MTIQLGDVAPNFTAETTEGTIEFHKWIGEQWCVLFSHPKDFTPVCTTELGTLSKKKAEFEKLGVKIAVVSVDTLEDHLEWTKDINRTQNCTVNYPIIADPKRHVATLYGMIHPNASDTLTVRSVYIIGPDKKVKLIISYPASTGRNFDEIFRVIHSLQLTAEHKVATPADWKKGEECIVLPTISNDEAEKIFPEGFTAVTPYLRWTPCPAKN